MSEVIFGRRSFAAATTHAHAAAEQHHTTDHEVTDVHRTAVSGAGIAGEQTHQRLQPAGDHDHAHDGKRNAEQQTDEPKDEATDNQHHVVGDSIANNTNHSIDAIDGVGGPGIVGEWITDHAATVAADTRWWHRPDAPLAPLAWLWRYRRLDDRAAIVKSERGIGAHGEITKEHHVHTVVGGSSNGTTPDHYA